MSSPYEKELGFQIDSLLWLPKSNAALGYITRGGVFRMRQVIDLWTCYNRAVTTVLGSRL